MIEPVTSWLRPGYENRNRRPPLRVDTDSAQAVECVRRETGISSPCDSLGCTLIALRGTRAARATVPSPPIRSRLLAEVLAFVRAASRLPGVLRIALIGSLTTGKPNPKDADLLVTVAGEADLAPLATLGRKLNGHCMAFRTGGEVFLADPQGRYLGRTCPWKECRPGVRLSCDALHCGQRPYLHDDLQVVRLADDLVRTPPIELWPAVVARVPVPQDVERELLEPLRPESSAWPDQAARFAPPSGARLKMPGELSPNPKPET